MLLLLENLRVNRPRKAELLQKVYVSWTKLIKTVICFKGTTHTALVRVFSFIEFTFNRNVTDET